MFVDVATALASQPSASIGGLGPFAPLADPVTDAGGNVFIGSTEGHLYALHPDGTPLWNQKLPDFNDAILTSPAVASDGSVFVVGGHARGSIRDHRENHSNVRDHRSTYHLYRFLPGGQLDANATSPIPVINDRGPMAPESIGRPAVWQLGGDEVILVTALYPTVGGTDLHVFAFAPSGGLLADWSVHQAAGAVTTSGGLLDLLFPGFTPGWFGPVAEPSLPGVAVATAGGEPYIVLVDRINRTLIGLAYVTAPEPHFEVRWQKGHPGYQLLSPPAMLRDWHSAVGIKNGVLFGGPSATPRADLPFISTMRDGLEDVFAAPTPAADGRTIAVTGGGEVIGFTDAVVSRLDFGADRTIAPAAASKTHVYVATLAGLHTLDATGSSVEAEYAWANGGAWSPVVGPGGHVYAMADHTLHVFAPPPAPRVPRERPADRLDVRPR